MSNAKNQTIIFLLGGCLYGLIEVVARGYTHWSMFLTGGFVLTALYSINKVLHKRSILLRALLGGCVITLAEFTVGCIVNLWLGMNVWDYSSQPFNLLGQICLRFFLIWIFICIPAYLLCDFLSVRLPEKDNYRNQ